MPPARPVHRCRHVAGEEQVVVDSFVGVVITTTDSLTVVFDRGQNEIIERHLTTRYVLHHQPVTEGYGVVSTYNALG
jgi:hypothetical protein